MRKQHLAKIHLLPVALIFSALFFSTECLSQLSITSVGSDFTINYETTVDGVNNGQYAGTGFTPSPASGQLDSDAWATTGMSEGSSSFGATKTTGDFARGIASAAVTTGGYYAFQVTTGDYGFGIQPGSDDWTPGSLTLRIINNTGVDIIGFNVSYNIYVRNDQGRGNSFNFSYSSDNITYTPVTSLDYTSPDASTGTTWITVPKSTTITGISITNGSYFYLRWNGDDVSGSGSRDEFALNDVVINAAGSAGVSNPASFAANAYSSSRNDLSWSLNASNDSVLIAWNSTNTFGTPSGVYALNASIPGGGTVLYKGTGTATSHTGLPANTWYYYKAFSMTTAHQYSTGVADSATTFAAEPSAHPADLAAVSNGASRIVVSWVDTDADNYLVKGSQTGYGGIVPPVDGVPETDATLVKNVAAGVQGHEFLGLTPNTTYYFEVFPYNGTGITANYKTDGTIPQASATTDELQLELIISEVADPYDSSYAKFVEITNTGTSAIDFSTTPVYLCRQSNGGGFNNVRLTGTLAANSHYVLAYINTNPNPDDSLTFDRAYNLSADIYSNYISGNGNDGYYLYYDGDQSTGTLIDAYGVIGLDGTGTAWEYTDGHAVRKRGITAPNTTWTSSEWVILRTCNADNMTPYAHAEDITWQGSVSDNWNERGLNWNGPHNWVPDASCNVTVPVSATYPVVTEKSACNTLNISSLTSLGIGATGSLRVVSQTP